MTKDPSIMVETLDNYLKSVNAEEAYFGPFKGDRTFFMVIDIQNPDMIPAIAEPLFQTFNAKMEFIPVMKLEEVKKGLQKIK